MENLPESIADEVKDFEVTVEPGHLTLIVSTPDGDLHTYTFEADDDGALQLQSQTRNGHSVSNDLGDVVKTLFEEHPVLSPSELSG